MVTLWAPSRGLCFSQRLCRRSIAPRWSCCSSRVSMEKQAIVPAVIVGGGRVGSAIEKMGGGQDTVVKRGEKVPLDSTGPIFVCTRNDVLDAVVEATPPHRREDLVFFQNGMLEPWLERKCIPDASQVLVYFAVAKLGDPPLDGKTDTDPDGLTAASGKWAPAVATRLHTAGLSCEATGFCLCGMHRDRCSGVKVPPNLAEVLTFWQDTILKGLQLWNELFNVLALLNMAEMGHLTRQA